MKNFENYKEFLLEDEALNWAKENYFELFNMDEKDERYKVLAGYTGTDFYGINLFLRNRKNNHENSLNLEKYQKNINIIDNILNQNFILEDIVLYRYINKTLLKFLLKGNNLKQNIMFEDKAFVSTGLIKENLKSFSKENNCKILLKLYVPKGTNGVYVSLYKKSILKEYEILLHRNTKFKILKIHHFLGKLMIECEVVK